MVDGLERELVGAAHVVRIDLTSEGSRVIAGRYAVEFTPTFLFFDRSGRLVERTQRIDPGAALARLRP